jgi:hypothetical protein
MKWPVSKGPVKWPVKGQREGKGWITSSSGTHNTMHQKGQQQDRRQACCCHSLQELPHFIGLLSGGAIASLEPPPPRPQESLSAPDIAACHDYHVTHCSPNNTVACQSIEQLIIRLLQWAVLRVLCVICSFATRPAAAAVIHTSVHRGLLERAARQQDWYRSFITARSGAASMTSWKGVST